MNRSKDAVWNDCRDSCTCLATSPLPFYTTVPALLVETVHSRLKPSQRYTRDALKQCELIWRSLSTVDVSRHGLNGNKDVVIRPMPAIFDPTVSWDDIDTVEFLKRLIYLLQYRRLNQLLHNETVWDGLFAKGNTPLDSMDLRWFMARRLIDKMPTEPFHWHFLKHSGIPLYETVSERFKKRFSETDICDKKHPIGEGRALRVRHQSVWF